MRIKEWIEDWIIFNWLFGKKKNSKIGNTIEVSEVESPDYHLSQTTLVDIDDLEEFDELEYLEEMDEIDDFDEF